MNSGGQCGIPIVLYETVRDLTRYLARLPTPARYETVHEQAAAEDVRGLLGVSYDQRGAHAVYAELMKIREQLRGAWDQLFAQSNVDVLMRPTAAINPTPIGEDVTTHAFGEEVPTFATVTRNGGPGSTSGQLALSIPAGYGKTGLPAGIALDGQRDRDDALLSLAQVIDSVVGVPSPLLG